MKAKKSQKNYGRMLNGTIAIVGLLLIISGLLIPEMGKNYLNTILISVGTSILSTAIVSFLTSYYLVKINTIKEIIEKWGLVGIYKTKAEMNAVSNMYLEKCKKKLDIVAVGMSGLLNVQEDTLTKLINKGVEIRIVSCNSKQMLNQREKDESIGGVEEPIGAFYRDVEVLNNWIKKFNAKDNLNIKFHSTYPAFSYLRIDDHVFWGPNLYLKKSQLCIAFEFKESGDGFYEFQDHFEKLWESQMLTTVLDKAS